VQRTPIFFSVTGNVYLDTATFSCGVGYYMVGSDVLECLSTGQWGDHTTGAISIAFFPALLRVNSQNRLSEFEAFHALKYFVLLGQK